MHYYNSENSQTIEDRIIDISKTEIPKLIKLMEKQVVEFSFIKSNGDIRIAHGTLSLAHIPIDKISERYGEDASCLTNTLYYDVDKQAWRAFSHRNFITIRKEDWKPDETKKDVIRNNEVQ